MKKEDAYRDKSGCYVAFEYDGHVFVLTQKNKTAEGKEWGHPFSFCAITSTTGFVATFQTAEEATAAVKKIGLKVIYTQEWEVLENKNFNSFCVDKLQWKEWHEYQEVLRHEAPFAAIAVGNRVYKDTYSTALSDGNQWVFYAGDERLFNYPYGATHKIDHLLIAARDYPDMKLFNTEEERTEWSLKYLEEYAAIPEPVVKKQEVVPVGSIVDPMGAWDADKQTYCCAAKHGVLYFPTWGKGSRCTFQSDSGTVLRYADNSKITGYNTYRSLCQRILAIKAQDTFVCYTQSREGYELFIKAHVSKEKQQEILKELPGVDMTEQQELPPGSVIEVNSYKSADVLMRTVPPNSTTEPLPPVGMVGAPKNSCIVNAFESQGTPKLRPVELPHTPEPEFVAAAVIVGEKIFRSCPVDIMTQDEWKFFNLRTNEPLRCHEGNELAEDLSLDITAPTLIELIAAAEKCDFTPVRFRSEANYNQWIKNWIVEAPKGTVTSVAVGKDTTPAVTLHLRRSAGPGSTWGIGTPTEFPATDINGKPLLSDTFRVKASPDSQPLTADSGIKTMKSGVTPQPSRSRIGKIAARPYEYVYDGPEQMGRTFVSRYRIDDEVWTRVGHELVKMKVTGIYVDSEKGKTTYRYGFGNTGKPENECYDTLFDLISAMTSISVEDLIAAAKEVV